VPPTVPIAVPWLTDIDEPGFRTMVARCAYRVLVPSPWVMST
jgi:hypothetical protein